MQNRYIQLFICHVLLVVKLGAGVDVAGAKTGSRDIAGYFNETNDVTITITLDDNEVSGGSNDLSNTRIMVYYGFNSTNTISITSTCLNKCNDIGWQPTFTSTNNTHVYTFTAAHLVAMKGSSPEGEFFDFKVFFSNSPPYDQWVDTNNNGTLDADRISVSASVAEDASLVIVGGSVDFGVDSVRNG
ncbi:uncharacterized protein METZ01_LOCUS319505, partial [marine metagenome]